MRKPAKDINMTDGLIHKTQASKIHYLCLLGSELCKLEGQSPFSMGSLI